jgi:hypothetical protein
MIGYAQSVVPTNRCSKRSKSRSEWLTVFQFGLGRGHGAWGREHGHGVRKTETGDRRMEKGRMVE